VEKIQKLTATVAEVMAARGESYSTVRNKLRARRYIAVKDGRATRILWESVLADLNNLPRAQFGARSNALKCTPDIIA
jgi:hypothetical protein